MDEDSRPFKTILNFRDVGVSVNHSSGTDLVKPNMLFRSGSIDDCSNMDGKKLRVKYNINTVINLHSKPRKFLIPSEIEKYEAEEGGNEVTSWNFLGIKYLHASLDGPAILKAEISRLSRFNKLKFDACYQSIHPNQAQNVLDTASNIPRGPIGHAQDQLDYMGPRIKAVFELLADPSSYPVIIYCRYGIASTPLIVILILLLLEVPLPDVQKDFVQSSLELFDVYETIVQFYKSRGCGPEWGGHSESWVRDISNYINSKYGGIIDYLKFIGVDEQVQETIVSLLKASPTETLVDIA